MSTSTASIDLDRGLILERFDRVRRRSAELFGLVTDEAYYSRPITLRNPVVFYEGHLAAFSVNTLIKKALRQPGIDAELEILFARGIDPELSPSGENLHALWPSRARVAAYVAEADARLREAIATAAVDVPGDPFLDRAEALHTIIEHEEMHQETLQYIWHRLPFTQKRRPADLRLLTEGRVPPHEQIAIPAGVATLGAARGAIPFGWDNELPSLTVDVAAFTIDRHDVSNGEFLEFVEAGGYGNESLWTPDAWAWRESSAVEHPLFWERMDGRWTWRGMFDRIPLPESWPVYVSHAEASAFARWRKRRLPTEAEYHRAAFGTPEGHERPLPWGDAPADETRGNAGAVHWDPVPVGSYPAGVSAFGVHDLTGNGWEWTASPFRPFPGFQAMPSYPEYSADFFDDAHFVLKGGSPATPFDHIRRSFRNWFRPYYPYVYATFRTVRG